MHLALVKRKVSGGGGLEKQSEALAKAFVKAGVTLTWITQDPLPKHPLFEMLSLGKPSKMGAFDLFRFNRRLTQHLKTHSYDAVFCLDRATAITHLRAGNGLHLQYLKQRCLIEPWYQRLLLLFNPTHLLTLWIEKKALTSPTFKLCFTNSQWVRQAILKTYPLPEEKVQCIHNGVEWDQYAKAFESSLESPPDSSFKLLFVGNGYRRKGLDLLLEALQSFKGKAWKLYVVGKDKRIASYKQVAKKLGLEDHVLFEGPQADLLPYYQRCDALAIPSIYDPFANVTLEALAMGLFVLSSAYNGGSEVLSSDSGIIVNDLFNKKSFVQALDQLFSKKKTKQSALKIRQSVSHLQLENQLQKIVVACLNSLHQK